MVHTLPSVQWCHHLLVSVFSDIISSPESGMRETWLLIDPLLLTCIYLRFSPLIQRFVLSDGSDYLYDLCKVSIPVFRSRR